MTQWTFKPHSWIWFGFLSPATTLASFSLNPTCSVSVCPAAGCSLNVLMLRVPTVVLLALACLLLVSRIGSVIWRNYWRPLHSPGSDRLLVSPLDGRSSKWLLWSTPAVVYDAGNHKEQTATCNSDVATGMSRQPCCFLVLLPFFFAPITNVKTRCCHACYSVTGSLEMFCLYWEHWSH